MGLPARSNSGQNSNQGMSTHSPRLSFLQVGKLRWTLRPAPAPESIEEVLKNPDHFLADPGMLIANSGLITMGRISPLTAGGATLLLRRLNYGRLRHLLRDIFRPTRAERAFWHGLSLEQAGVATPRVLAVGVERLLRWPRRAYLITEWVPGAITLRTLLNRERFLPRAQVYLLADLLARLHDRGFSHRDLNSANILFDDQLRPYLIDLDGVRNFGQLREARSVLDLRRFAREFVAFPRALKWNALRFLKRYCQQRRMENNLPRLEAQISPPLMRRQAAGPTRWQ